LDDPSEDAGECLPLADWHCIAAILQISASSLGDFPFKKSLIEEFEEEGVNRNIRSGN
jgi:hypothetical protein